MKKMMFVAVLASAAINLSIGPAMARGPGGGGGGMGGPGGPGGPGGMGGGMMGGAGSGSAYGKDSAPAYGKGKGRDFGNQVSTTARQNQGLRDEQPSGGLPANPPQQQ